MKKLFYFLLMIAISVSACKKGDVGPAGKDGTSGTNGKNGNANVKSYLITVKPAEWVLFFGSYYAYPKLAAITDSVLNSGEVNVYYKSGTAWDNLPILGYNYGFNMSTTTGGYIWISHDGNTAPASDVVFRAIVISGGVSATSSKNMPFDYIKEKFELKE